MPDTHMGTAPSDMVVLEIVGGVQGLMFVRNLANGQSEPAGVDGWQVPAGRVLVITDVDWQYRHPNGFRGGGEVQLFRLFLQNLDDAYSPGVRVFESPVTLSYRGEGGASESMTTGFCVTANARIRPDVFPGPIGPPSGLQHALLRGYLMDA